MGVIKKVLHMNVGDGETSYAKNSGLQKVVISKALPVLNATLEDMCNNHIGFTKCFKMVDLGCSSGPNTLLATSHIINTLEDLCKQNNINYLPEFEVFLNDLPGNDFNNLFNLLQNLHQNGKQRGNYYIYGLPGSFYGRLLPRNSIHFAYSSYSLHWLSQVPEGLENYNKENIYMAMTSPRNVYEAYAKQYQIDFFRFLSARADEIISGGRMVLIFIGRSVEDPSTKDDLAIISMVAKTLVDLVAEGLVKMDDLYTFNMPVYTPCVQEVETAIQNEGSFTLDKLEISLVRWDANDKPDDNPYELFFDKNKSGKFVADCVRAFMEPMLASHFGNSIVNDLFERYTKRVAEHLSVEQPEYFNIVISLSRR